MATPGRAPAHASQRGAVLIVALIMLASMTLMATAAVQSSIMGLKVARNAEEGVHAFQTAQSAIDFAIADTGNLPMTGPLHEQATVDVAGDPFVVDPLAGESLQVTAERTIDCGMPPRIGNGSSMLAYSTFSFRVAADLDRTGTGRGQSSIRQGYLVLGPKC